MRIVKVSQAKFNKITEAESDQEKYNAVDVNLSEVDIMLAGGIDHVDQTKNQVVFHDRGCNGVDRSFIVRKFK